MVEESRLYHTCPDCPGYSELTAKGLNNRIRAFTVPFNSCSRCHDKARDAFAASEKSSRWKSVLQDRIDDVYEVK